MKIEGTSYQYGAGFILDGAQDLPSRKPLGYAQYSGTLCQQSGMWRTGWNTTPVVVSIEKGTVMPHHSGQVVHWQLESYSANDGEGVASPRS